MNTSLPILPLLAGLSEGKSAVAGDIQGKQILGGGGPGFGLFLEQASNLVSVEVAGEFAGDPEALQGGTELVEKLQSLPEGGKLLPLLQQVLDSAAARGADPQQVIRQVAEKIQQLDNAKTPVSAESALGALFQVMETLPGGPPAASHRPLAVSSQLPENGRHPVPERMAARVISPQAGQDTDAAIDVTADESRPGPDNVPGLERRQTGQGSQIGQHGQMAQNSLMGQPGQAGQSSQAGLERALSVLQQQGQVPEQQQAEQAVLGAAIKRLLGAGNRTAPEAPSRLDPVSVMPAPAVSAAAATGAATPVLSSVSVDVPLNQSNWNQAFGEKIQWMLSQRVQGAEIRLNPANLGPMEVRVQVHNEQASIQFTSAHAVVRETLEAALPRLREMLESSGVEVVDVDISGQSFAEQRQAREEGDTPAWNGVAGTDESGDPELLAETPLAPLVEAGRLDIFA